eukprot:TRINITY_DN23731_c0_g1_i1.p1 TRINITY_DN23731_c0_g1~~TRINITY_DN23731_c0_g1_i1.p1  ORF type:complete len:358 (-),score=80.57 TRINITY_DN23731_c0_g1_i1:174-1208(-)
MIIIILLNVLASLFVVLQQFLRDEGTIAKEDGTDSALTVVVTAIPIVLGVFMSASNKMGAHGKWLGLRGGAQHTLKEIFRYRTRVGEYGHLDWTGPRQRSVLFTTTTENIRTSLAEGDVFSSALIKPDPDLFDYTLWRDTHGDTEWQDDMYSLLNPSEYYRTRLLPQIQYYVGKTPILERRLRFMQWAIYILSAGSALLGVLGQQLWIAFVSAVVAAITTYMEFDRLQSLLVKYNKTVAELNKIKEWWDSLQPVEKAATSKFVLFVEGCEAALDNEVSTWMQSVSTQQGQGEEEGEDEDPANYVPTLDDFQLKGKREKLFDLLRRTDKSGFRWPDNSAEVPTKA